MFISSAIIVCLFFGGYNFPFISELGLSHNMLAIPGTVIFFAKVFFFIFFFMWIRWTIPRFRYDQLMRVGWKVLIPLAVVNIVLTAVYLMWKHDLWNTTLHISQLNP